MNIPQEYLDEISQHFPSLQSEDIKIFDDGWDYLVCVAKNTEVFRFPRRPEYESTLPREIAFLQQFAPLSPIAVPQMTLQHFPNQLPYARYPFINGVPFTKELAQTLSIESLQTIAQQLGKFLSVLHAFPIQQAKELGFGEITDVAAEWQQHAEKTKQLVFPLLSESKHQRITKYYEEFFELIKRSTITHVVTHGDIMPPHILIDEKEHTLTGIIDFGDMAIGDPAFDFGHLGIYGQAFLDDVYANYQSVCDDTFDMRRKFYANREVFANLEHAIVTKNEEDITIYLERLQSVITV